MNRRELLAGGLALGASSLIAGPTWTKPLDLTTSRIFGHVDPAGGDMAFMLRTTYPEYKGSESFFYEAGSSIYEAPTLPCFSIVKHPKDYAVDFGDNIRDIEYKYMYYCPHSWYKKGIYDGQIRQSGRYVPDSVFRIEAMSNRVARSTRRGRANNIVASPRTIKLLEPFWTIPREDKTVISRYKFHVDENFPDTRVFLFYRGTSKYDVAGMLFPDLKLALNQLPKGGSNFGYGQMLVFQPRWWETDDGHRYSLPYLKKHGLILT